MTEFLLNPVGVQKQRKRRWQIGGTCKTVNVPFTPKVWCTEISGLCKWPRKVIPSSVQPTPLCTPK